MFIASNIWNISNMNEACEIRTNTPLRLLIWNIWKQSTNHLKHMKAIDQSFETYESNRPIIWNICKQSTLHFRQSPNQRYTNADPKIYRYLCLHIKLISWRFRIIEAVTFWVMRTRDIRNVSLQTCGNNKIKYVKK